MSLLQHDSTEELDDAARGEELTKGTSHVVLATIIAAVVVSAAIALYYFLNRQPPPATGEIVAVWAHPVHGQTSRFDANGAPMPQQTFDQVLVFAQVKLHNQSDHPLVLINVLTNATLNDGIHSSYAANTGDYGRVFLAYPDIPVPHGQALSPLHTVLEAGQTVEGMFVSSFQLTKEQWDARKNLDFTFVFRYQPELVLAPRVAVTEQ